MRLGQLIESNADWDLKKEKIYERYLASETKVLQTIPRGADQEWNKSDYSRHFKPILGETMEFTYLMGSF